jgi:hypothetical protein
MTQSDNSMMPGFWRICCVDAYLFKLACVFLPLISALIFYNMVTGRPSDDFMLPSVFIALLVCVIYYRWSAVVHVFKNHVVLACSVADISSGTGLLGVQIYISFFTSCDGENAERGCFLVRFNPRVKKLKKGDAINVFWNQHKNLYVIKEAYLDD